MLKPIITLSTLLLLAACATPGYDYSARIAPNFPDAAAYTDVDIGRFTGPAGDIAEAEFITMIMDTELEGQAWFIHSGTAEPQGIYEGHVTIEGYEEDISYTQERKCVEYDGIFDCEHRAIVESECSEQTVLVRVTATLIDLAENTGVFTSENGGTATQEDCVEINQHPNHDGDLGEVRDTHSISHRIADAPIGMIEDATREAVRQFRYDIAPYTKTMRAEIMTEALTNEVANDTRFELAVKATKNGEIMGACAQWNELGLDYPKAPSILHNIGSCAEARGDMAAAQTHFAEAAEIARAIPLLKDKKARPIFDALERVSARRRDSAVIDRATGSSDQPANRPES